MSELAPSLERITKSDLRRLTRIAADERNDFFSRHPEWKLLYARRLICTRTYNYQRPRPSEWKLLYARRLICTALCGRSALHFCNGTAGVEEFDVWSFYAAHSEAPFPHHRQSYRDFGNSKFDKADGAGNYAGRRIRLTGRSLSALPGDNPPGDNPGDNPVVSLQSYFRAGRSTSARKLRDSAAVLIEPENYLAYVAWPTLIA